MINADLNKIIAIVAREYCCAHAGLMSGDEFSQGVKSTCYRIIEGIYDTFDNTDNVRKQFEEYISLCKVIEGKA